MRREGGDAGGERGASGAEGGGDGAGTAEERLLPYGYRERTKECKIVRESIELFRSLLNLAGSCDIISHRYTDSRIQKGAFP